VICAGVPCQGHSLNNTRGGSEKAQYQNAEITVAASYIEKIRPKYVIIENVRYGFVVV